MKMLLLSLLIVMSFMMLTACNRDADVQALADEVDSITNEIVAKIDASPDAAGVDAAQKVIDARKPALQEKIKALKVGSVSDEMKKKFEESLKKSGEKLVTMAEKHGAELAMSDGAMDRFKKLMSDYGSMFDTK